MAKLDNLGDGCGMGLMGHCRYCDSVIFAHFKFFPDQTRIEKKCSNCGVMNTLVDDDIVCQKCEKKHKKKEDGKTMVALAARIIQLEQELALARSQTAQAGTFTCPHCGGQRPTGYRFCPHCRLDIAGKPADRGT